MTQQIKRWFKHLSLDVGDVRRILPVPACQRLEQRIQASEARHLGELRVCVEASLSPAQLWQGVTPRQRAVALFSQLRVWDTEANNGVLIYLLLAERRIEVLADRGLMNKLDQADHWERLVQRLSEHLSAKQVEAGLAASIDEVCALLQKHYPVKADQSNDNELPDAIVLI